MTVTVTRHDIAGDVGALLMASGPADSRDRTCVARGRGLPVDLDEASGLRDVLFRSLDLLAVAAAKLAALEGRPYDEVVAEWKALLDAESMGAEPS